MARFVLDGRSITKKELEELRAANQKAAGA